MSFGEGGFEKKSSLPSTKEMLDSIFSHGDISLHNMITLSSGDVEDIAMENGPEYNDAVGKTAAYQMKPGFPSYSCLPEKRLLILFTSELTSDTDIPGVLVLKLKEDADVLQQYSAYLKHKK